MNQLTQLSVIKYYFIMFMNRRSRMYEVWNRNDVSLWHDAWNLEQEGLEPPQNGFFS